MPLSRRELLTASALLLAGPSAALRVEGKEAAPGAKPIVLCWNENHYGPSPAARQAISHSIADGCRYPSDEEMDELTEAIAHHEGTKPDHIVTGTGSGELLRALGLLYGQGNGEIILAQPTYLELPEYARLRGAALKFVPVDAQLRHDLPAMRAAVSERTRAVYLCNPNNPTGTALSATEVRAFVGSLPENVVAVIDEAYLHFMVGPDFSTAAALVDGDRRVVVLRTFSKIHGMAGIRCGYAITRPDIASTLASACMTTPNIFAVRAARASLGDKAFLTDVRRRIVASRTGITSELRRLGLRYADPQGNFVFFDTGMPLERFTERMRAHNILVGRLFPPYNSWCRITIGTEPEVAAFLKALSVITTRG